MPESTTFADYELIESLGSGNHGECFLARPPGRLGVDREHVVLKVLSANATREACLRVAQELRRVAAVAEPRLVTLLDAGRVGGTMFTAAPYFESGSLARPVVAPARDHVLRAGADAARAAHALHEAGIVHRAIKPTNIVLDGGSGAGGRLADVGLAHALSPGQTMTSFGSAAAIEYVEPSALLGQPAGRASDIWSLAVALHRALTSTSVYADLPGDGLLAALRHVIETPPVLADGLSDGEAELLSWCLSADRSARPATAALVAERLDRLAKEAT